MAVFTAIGTALGASGAMAPLLGLGATAGVAAGGMGLGAIMKKDKTESGGYQMPQAPAAPTLEDASVKAQLRADERKRAIARSKTVVSNPLGLQDEAEVARKKLLGG